jgi:hypothetical protein
MKKKIILHLVGAGIVFVTLLISFYIIQSVQLKTLLPLKYYFVLLGNTVYLNNMIHYNVYIPVINLGAFIDIILFYIFLKFKQYDITRGIGIGILALIIIFVLIRYF